jgi:hypothetical protein
MRRGEAAIARLGWKNVGRAPFFAEFDALWGAAAARERETRKSWTSEGARRVGRAPFFAEFDAL